MVPYICTSSHVKRWCLLSQTKTTNQIDQCNRHCSKLIVSRKHETKLSSFSSVTMFLQIFTFYPKNRSCYQHFSYPVHDLIYDVGHDVANCLFDALRNRYYIDCCNTCCNSWYRNVPYFCRCFCRCNYYFIWISSSDILNEHPYTHFGTSNAAYPGV